MYFSTHAGARLIRGWFQRLRRYFRQRRYHRIVDLLELYSSNRLILDLGGGRTSFFTEMFPRPEQIVLLDINYQFALEAKRRRPDIHIVVGDGERLPFADHWMEATICNSVIEHTNHPEKLAEEICRVSQAYFVQTPNGTFPMETHSFIAIPFYHSIPWEWLRKFLCRLFGARYEYISSVHYLSEYQLRHLFSEAVLAYEKTLGMTKSFYVYRVASAKAVDQGQGQDEHSPS